MRYIYFLDLLVSCFLALCVSLVCFSAVCFSAMGVTKSNTLIYCSEGSPVIFNPQIAADGPSFDASTGIYNRLIRLDKKNDKIIPSIAKSWLVSKDKLVYTFKLKKSISFHSTPYFKPSRFLNADDVLFSFHRQLKKSHKYHLTNGGNYMFFNSFDLGNLIKKIVKVDAYTIKIFLTKVEATFLINLTMEFASILSKEYADQLLKLKKQENIDFYPIGTGPFIFKQYVKDSVVRLKKNPHYFLKPARLNGIIIAIVPDISVRVQKLKKGECDIISQPAPLDLVDLKKHPNIKLVGGRKYNISYLGINVTKGPFKKLKVRKAIHHALNRAMYIKAIYHGYADIAKNPFPSNMWSYNHKVKDYKYSVKKARQLLKEAGYENGFTTTLWTLPISRPYNPNGKKLGELMQADLLKVGIKVKLMTYDWATYLSRLTKGEQDLFQLGWTGDNPDPDGFLRVLLSCDSIVSGMNTARWCYPAYDKIIKKALLVFNQKTRSVLYKKAQVIIKKQVPWVTIAHTHEYLAMLKKVQGYQYAPFGSKSFVSVYFKK